MITKQEYMYKIGDLVEDFTTGQIYAREILDPDGDVICHVIEFLHTKKGERPADDLISHLNRGKHPLSSRTLNHDY